ncbi:hypothetical protein [Longimicrobium terrae]|uniref:Uncharacterized protein n=1 Tax=Longimicrobium terrae TaxID=1639882 RepID=A0A841GVA6_9BACT|nr:hypothetical protein [Longimicrobium terrae]MBB4635184.1 hypothetical protein [Longimicrobium terrae]MBB6069578.1 hypothetical protein [Longimicrobium terrae]NNC31619.1 hypothetical protein [Longimicrobium terrae]
MPAILRSRLLLLAFAALALGGSSLLYAQELKCYVETCVPTASGGESCVVKPIKCPQAT